MIKDSTYIRKFTTKQRQQMERVALEHGLSTIPKILFFALDQYLEQQGDKERLERIIAYKQKKIETLIQQNEKETEH